MALKQADVFVRMSRLIGDGQQQSRSSSVKRFIGFLSIQVDDSERLTFHVQQRNAHHRMDRQLEIDSLALNRESFAASAEESRPCRKKTRSRIVRLRRTIHHRLPPVASVRKGPVFWLLYL